MRRYSPHLYIVAALCFVLSACATDEPPAVLQPSVPASILTVTPATPTVAPTPRFVTATPTPVVVPSLPGPVAARVISPHFTRLPATQTISDFGDPQIIDYLRANSPTNTPHFQPPCEQSETAHIWGASSFITADIGWMLCGRANFKDSQVKQLYKTDDGGIHWTLISATSSGDQSRRIPKTLPEGGLIGYLFFVDEGHGWLSVNSMAQTSPRT
ncbi:MAG: hypothetical protein ACR2JW_15015 [Thermomicrobiales bacterium]